VFPRGLLLICVTLSFIGYALRAAARWRLLQAAALHTCAPRTARTRTRTAGAAGRAVAAGRRWRLARSR